MKMFREQLILLLAVISLVPSTSWSAHNYFRSFNRSGRFLDSLPKDCGKIPANVIHLDRIAGGINAIAGQYPPYVQIYYQYQFSSRPNFFCGGTLLTERHVITAGHCAEHDVSDGDKWFITATYKRSQINGINVIKRCLSKKYNNIEDDDYFHDVAILKLEESVGFTELVQPACLTDRPIADNEQIFSIGLGYTNSSKDLEGILQVLPVNKMACNYTLIDNSRVCFKSNNPRYVGDSCKGDSGGGLFAVRGTKLVLVAMTSFGPDRCESGFQGYSVNADVYQLYEDIEDLLAECA